MQSLKQKWDLIARSLSNAPPTPSAKPKKAEPESRQKNKVPEADSKGK